MQTQMTERDKRLIVMLSLIVIIVGFGYWGIRPALKKTKTINKDYEKQKDIQEVNELKLNQLPIIEIDAESYDELVAEEQKNFYSIMTSSEIDRYFTNMALSHNLYAYDLSISIGSEPVGVNPYQYSNLAYAVASEGFEFSVDDTEDSSSDTTEDADDDVSPLEAMEDPYSYVPSIAFNSEIYGVDIGMRLSGKRSDLQALIDELSNSEKKILVRNFTWSEESRVVNEMPTEEGAEPETTLEVVSVLNINLTLYMCDTTSMDGSQVNNTDNMENTGDSEE